MKTPNTILDFNQHSWFAKVKQLQRLKLDMSNGCALLGFYQANDCELLLEQTHLQIKTNAALSTRLRQIEPDLNKYLNEHGWAISRISFIAIRNAQLLSKHIPSPEGTNPNVLKYGRRLKPTPEQSAMLKLKRK
jgi:hypothetical protein